MPPFTHKSSASERLSNLAGPREMRENRELDILRKHGYPEYLYDWGIPAARAIKYDLIKEAVVEAEKDRVRLPLHPSLEPIVTLDFWAWYLKQFAHRRLGKINVRRSDTFHAYIGAVDLDPDEFPGADVRSLNSAKQGINLKRLIYLQVTGMSPPRQITNITGNQTDFRGEYLWPLPSQARSFFPLVCYDMKQDYYFLKDGGIKRTIFDTELEARNEAIRRAETFSSEENVLARQVFTRIEETAEILGSDELFYRETRLTHGLPPFSESSRLRKKYPGTRSELRKILSTIEEALRKGLSIDINEEDGTKSTFALPKNDPKVEGSFTMQLTEEEYAEAERMGYVPSDENEEEGEEG